MSTLLDMIISVVTSITKIQFPASNHEGVDRYISPRRFPDACKGIPAKERKLTYDLMY